MTGPPSNLTSHPGLGLEHALTQLGRARATWSQREVDGATTRVDPSRHYVFCRHNQVDDLLDALARTHPVALTSPSHASPTTEWHLDTDDFELARAERSGRARTWSIWWSSAGDDPATFHIRATRGKRIVHHWQPSQGPARQLVGDEAQRVWSTTFIATNRFSPLVETRCERFVFGSLDGTSKAIVDAGPSVRTRWAEAPALGGLLVRVEGLSRPPASWALLPRAAGSASTYALALARCSKALAISVAPFRQELRKINRLIA